MSDKKRSGGPLDYTVNPKEGYVTVYYDGKPQKKEPDNKPDSSPKKDNKGA